jgi:hypothetical protein
LDLCYGCLGASTWNIAPKPFWSCLTRIQEQVELVREQAVLSADAETISQRIDQVTATLGSTSQWVSDQQKIYGAVED